MKSVLLKAVAVALLTTTAFHCFADEQMLDIDTKWRAKIAKEKVKQAARDRAENAKDNDSNAADRGQCGSQSIGNVDNTGNRPGAGPREVFVFAPNAINIVGAGGCR